MDDVITLVSVSYTQDEIGNQIAEKTEREAFAEVKSITRSEFSAASLSGYHPSLCAICWKEDYCNEQYLKYGGKTLKIYRTFSDGDYIELYAEEKAGTV